MVITEIFKHFWKFNIHFLSRDGPNAVSTPIKQRKQRDPQEDIVTQPLQPIQEQVAAVCPFL